MNITPVLRKTNTWLCLGILCVAWLASCATTPASIDKSRLQGAEWLVVELEGRDIDQESGLTLRFSGASDVKGSAACNEFSAPVEIARNVIAFGPVAVTERSCESLIKNIDKVYFAALKKVRTWQIDADTLRLKNGDGVILVRFHRSAG